jgi:hypothetical protein
LKESQRCKVEEEKFSKEAHDCGGKFVKLKQQNKDYILENSICANEKEKLEGKV